MPKKGVFGMKAMPLDAPEPAKMPPEPKEVTVKEAKTGGFIVNIRGGKSMTKDQMYSSMGNSDQHACSTMEDVNKLMDKHFGTEKD